ncbi:MAG: arginine--tRNA ligase [Saprospiraceae bacterium]|nr:MAG: arginine--tRNA ligase [Saprospiraceae bacterium]
MDITNIIQNGVISAVQSLYGGEVGPEKVNVSITRPDFEGNYTVVVFPFTGIARKKPEVIGAEIGAYLVKEITEVESFNVIKGFLNLVVSEDFWRNFLQEIYQKENFGKHPSSGEKVMVEFSSPNTNKPLHLGHIRNILLGWSTAKIMEAAGHEVIKVQVVNDRGIAICKSMLAWQLFGENATPESTGSKSDHFVGDFYVRFEQAFQEEYREWQKNDEAQKIFKANKKEEQGPDAFFKAFKDTYFNEFSKLGAEARAMLIRWENGEEATLALWRKMNNWVYEGFAQTYEQLGVSFDKNYYESNTYLLGKDMTEIGLEKGVFYRKEDGSIWANLEDVKLDHKTILRSDGTSLYITQDLGTAHLRYKDFGFNRMVYVVADEQNYHFKVLFEVLKKLGEPYAHGLHHLAYGMVDLPTGKMKSREGTVVDADDLMAEVIAEAQENSKERDTTSDLAPEKQQEIIRKIGLAALKFFIIKVNPKKRMTFDPKESVDLKGQTGPYVQNAYVRIKSVLRKGMTPDPELARQYGPLEDLEKELLGQLYEFPGLILTAAEDFDPSVIANFCYALAKNYHRFYHDYSILSADTEAAKHFRIMLSTAIANALKNGMELLGIEMPERM